jgi:hypothetical protein
MARAVISLPLDKELAKQVQEQARKAGKTRTEYLRDIVSGHLRVAKFRELRELVQQDRKPDWPKTEDEVVAVMKAERRRHKADRA